MTRSVILIFISLLAALPLMAQVPGPDFCDKKWYCEMTKDADGNTSPPEKGTENNYMHFLCDSSFTLSEGTILLKGKWEFDAETMTITLVQQQIETMPERISFHIIDFDEGHLVIVGRQGTDSDKTVYFYTK